ncbi:MAG: 16S rRNA (cytidine(1402)-2'-O)-methyltransferase [Gammaproteobacteria bacterium]
MNPIERPALYVVATPIGNRGDLSPRAAHILAHVDVIAAEDTRVSGALLRDAGIRTSLLSVHEHNEADKVPGLIARIEGGAAMALISDAGTPLISDPGFHLVRAARAAGINVFTVPGPCAAIAALSIAGLPSDQFLFAGFVAAKSAARKRQFEAVRGQRGTLIFYASKRNLGAALDEATAIFGADRPAAIGRELTKLHEQMHCATLGELSGQWAQSEQRGEWVLLIAGAPAERADEASIERVLRILLKRVSVRDAAAMAAEILQIPKREAYALGLALNAENNDDDTSN